MSGVKVTVYLNKTIAEALREAYPDAKTLGGAVQLFIYEVLAGTIEKRKFRGDISDIARALLRLKSVGKK